MSSGGVGGGELREKGGWVRVECCGSWSRTGTGVEAGVGTGTGT